MPHAAVRPNLSLLSILLVAGCVAYVQQQPDSLGATVACAVAVLVAVLVIPRAAASTPQLNVSQGRVARVWVGLGLALLVAGSGLLVTHWNAAFYLGWGLVLVATGLAAHGLREPQATPHPHIAWTRSEIALVCVALGAGALLRFHQYDVFPGPYTTHAIEEQQTGLGATAILQNGRHPWEFALDYHLTALALSFTDAPTFNTIRVPFSLASWLSIVVAHLLFRQLFSRPAACFGTLLFACSSWNILYSRCAHPIFLSNLVVVGVFAALIAWGRTGRRSWLPWIGLLTASTLYSYAGYRGTALFVGVYLLGRIVRARQDAADVRRGLVDAAIVTCWLVAVAVPIAGQLGRVGLENYYLEAAHRALANREYYTDDSESFLRQRVERVRDVARLFVHEGDGSLTFNRPGTPMVDPFTATFFLPGLLLALLRPRRAQAWFFLFVFFVLLAAGTVFVQNLDVRRLQGVTVLVCYFAALFFDQAFASTRKQLTRAIALLVAAGAFAWSYRLYHVDMAGDPAVRRAFRDHYTAMIHYGREQRPERIALLSIIHQFFDPGYHYRLNYSWLIDPVLRGHDAADLLELIGTDGVPAATLVVQEPMEPSAAAQVLTAVYPDAVCTMHAEPDAPSLSLVACQVPEGARPRSVPFGLHAQYWVGPVDDTPDIARDEPYLGYGLVPRPCTTPHPGEFCTARWSGRLQVPADGTYSVRLEWLGRTTFAASLGGRSLSEHAQPIRPGLHEVHVEARLPRDWETGVRLVLLRDGQPTIPLFLEAN